MFAINNCNINFKCDMETYKKYKDIRFKNNNKYYEKMLSLL